MHNQILNLKKLENKKFGCKDYTKSFRPEKIQMINKVLREKSHCAVCRSNKSRFLKQKIN